MASANGKCSPKPPVEPNKNARLLRPNEVEYSRPAKKADPEVDYQPLTSEEWKELVATFYLNRRRLLSIPGVVGVDIGYKISDHAFTNRVAIRVHVERKLPPGYFNDCKYNLIPRSDAPKEEVTPEQQYCGPKGKPALMDVIEAKYRPLQMSEPPRQSTALERPRRLERVNRRRRLDPLVGGISIGTPQTPVGTLGALVWDKTDGSVCILSNWHVLAGDLHAEIGNPCFQPGRLDQGTSGDVIARLKRWSFNRHTDAAIAELTGSRHYCAGEIVSMYQQISGVEKEPYLGMKVFKSGRSSGFTPGFIDGLYFSAPIQYSNGIVRVFEDQIHIAPIPPDNPSKPVLSISEPGDSGSVWVTESNGEGYLAVGLHFAGDLPHSAFGEYALANPMSIVAERLNFSFRPLFLEIRDEDVVQEAPRVAAQPLHFQNGHRNGIQPVGFIEGGRLNGQGGQPDPLVIDPTGRT